MIGTEPVHGEMLRALVATAGSSAAGGALIVGAHLQACGQAWDHKAR